MRGAWHRPASATRWSTTPTRWPPSPGSTWAREAVLFAYPDMGRRWFSITLHSLWMPALATLGSASGEGKAARWLVSGPGWQGTVPKGVRHLRSPTRYVALLGRIQTSGSDADLRAVQALQAQMRLVPQTRPTQAGGAPAASAEPTPAAGPGDVPRQVVQAMDIAQYFNQLARLLGTAAPPAAEDAPLLANDGAHRPGARQGLPHGRRWSRRCRRRCRRTPARAMERLAAYRPQLVRHGGRLAGAAGRAATSAPTT